MIYPIPADVLQRIAVRDGCEWESGPIRGNEDRSIRWITVAEVGPTKLKLGLSNDGYWVRGGGATVELANGPHAITFLPCLEIPLQELQQTIRSGLIRIGLPPEFECTFPYADLIVAGLESRSEFWIKVALERIQEGERSERVIDAIRVASASAPTQKLRHSARRLLVNHDQ